MKMMKKGYKRGGKMPDLSGDGEVTQEDVLIGRGVLDKKGKAKKLKRSVAMLWMLLQVLVQPHPVKL